MYILQLLTRARRVLVIICVLIDLIVLLFPVLVLVGDIIIRIVIIIIIIRIVLGIISGRIVIVSLLFIWFWFLLSSLYRINELGNE